MSAAGSGGLGPPRTSRLQLALCVAFVVAVVFVGVPAFAANTVPLGVLLQGVELGAVNGMLAIGLILTYRANRVVNFAYGAMGGLAGTLGVMLYLGQHVNWFASLAIGLAAGAAVGALVDLLLRWRFAKAPRLVVMVATIGLSQVLGGVQAFLPGWLHGPPLLGAFRTPLSGVHVDIRPVLFDGNDLLVLGVLLVVPAALSWFLLRTDAGVAIRSLAENPERARLLGIPVRRLSTLVWVLAGVLAALTVMINGPSQGVTQSVLSGPTLLLPALAAGVVARMERLTVAFGAAIAIGVLNSVVAFNVQQASVTDVVLLAVILVALLLQRRGREDKGGTDQVWMASGVARAIPDVLRRLPEVRVTRALLSAVVLGLVVTVPLFGGPGRTLEYTIALCFGVAALSLVVLSGWSGSVSLGQFAFAGVGGVLAGDLILKTNTDLFQCLGAAAVAGAILAVVVGLPALRVRGEFLAVTTLALAVCVNSFFLNPTDFPSIIPADFSRPLVFARIDLSGNRAYYYFCLVVLVLATLFVKGLRQARAGRVLQASRDNLAAAEAMGVPTVRVRLTAFSLAGALAGLAGALYVITLQSSGLNTFDPSLSVLVFSMAVIGGVGSIGGALFGVALVQTATYSFPQYQQIIAGTGLLLVLLVLPGGLNEGLQRVRDVCLRAVARRRGIEVPSLAGRTGGIGPEQPGVGVLPHAAPQPTAARQGSSPLLACQGVVSSYGPVRILFGVDLQVDQHEIVALLGTNGAGKSTLLRAISGLMDLDSGAVHFDGQRINGRTPEAITRRGVALMPGGRGIFPTLSVEENLRLAAWLLRGDEAALAQARAEMLSLFPVLGHRHRQPAGTLSGGEQQMLSLAMALTVKPRLLLIDELSLGLAPTVVARLLEVVRALHDDGMTIVIVEQSINVALDIAQRVVFMEKGEVRFTGPADQLLSRTDLLRSVFIEGGVPESTPSALSTGAPSRPAAPSAVRQPDHGQVGERGAVLECIGLTKRYGGVTAANAVSLTVRPGELVGLVGHNGAGKTTLMDLISGFVRLDAGQLRLGDRDLGGLSAHQRALAGLGRTFQEARLFPSLTVRETLTVALERHLHARGLLAAGLRLPASLDAEHYAARRVAELIELMGLGDFADALAGELSTGTRRILELACVMAQEPQVLLLDEPSAGVAQRETEAMGPLLQRVQRETGCALLVIEHDMPLLTAICDRLIALELGQVIAEGTPVEVLAHPAVIASYLGLNETAINRSGPAPALAGVGES